MRALFTLSFALMMFTTSSMAEVYKCKTDKNKTIYADHPCTSTPQSMMKLPNQAVNTENRNVMRRLDDAVKQAINNQELDRAEALASTPEQKTLVAKARQEAAKNKPAKTEAEINAEKAQSSECIEAQSDLEEATKLNLDPPALNAKTSLMRAKCGIKEPETVIVNNNNGYYPPLLIPQPYPNGNYPNGHCRTQIEISAGKRVKVRQCF